jgi:hypothetical protein
MAGCSQLKYQRPQIMILKFIFNQLSLENKVKYLHRKGVALGTRFKDGRQIHMYMLRDLFVEVLYTEDKTYLAPEEAKVLNGLNNLHQYLETEFRSRF